MPMKIWKMSSNHSNNFKKYFFWSIISGDIFEKILMSTIYLLMVKWALLHIWKEYKLTQLFQKTVLK